MKLNLKEIAQKEQWRGYSLFDFDYAKIKENTEKRPEWVHFGAGNIFRIFPAMLCHSLIEQGKMETGIVAGEGFDFEIIEKIYKPHDNLTLGVTLKADGSISRQVIAGVMDSVRVSADFEDELKTLERIFTSPSLKMVSFTITEKGYALYNAKGELFAPYRDDFENGPEHPQMFLCYLVRLLYQRYLKNLPVALVSMDNCSHNGEKLQAAVMAIASAWIERRFMDPGFEKWLKNPAQVAFPWTMIDKITPRPDASVQQMLKEDGFEDADPIVTSRHTYIAPFVNAEEPQYLVVEDTFPNGRPPLEDAGVYFCDRETVNKVEKMKVCTCLNPLHTALAVSGCLLGFEKIADEMRDGDLKKMVHILGYKEGLPVVVNPGIIDPRAFLDEVIEKRIPNPFMPDTPQRIATDTSQKLSIRFGHTAQAYLESGKADQLKVIPLVYAMWARYLLALDDRGEEFTPSFDPLYDEARALLGDISLGSRVEAEQLKPLLSQKRIFGYDVTETSLFPRVVELFNGMLTPGGVRKMVRTTVSE